MVSDGFVHACAGGAGGMIAMTATYPLVSISMRAAVEQSRARQKSMLEAAHKIVREEGVQGLYSGLSSSLLGISIANFVYYGFFETAREMILASKNKGAAANATSAAAKIVAGGALSTAESMLAGALAGSATTIITNPIWVVNTRQTVRVGEGEGGATAKGKTAAGSTPPAVKKLSFLETVRHIVSRDGVPALWRGLGPALFLVINPILQYTAFEQLKNVLVRSRLARGVSAALSDADFFLLGALSKLFATGLTYPQVLVKSRQQASSGTGPGPAGQRNFFMELREIVKNEGVAGLYRGVGPKLTQSVLTAAILFSSQARLFAALSALRSAPKAVKA